MGRRRGDYDGDQDVGRVHVLGFRVDFQGVQRFFFTVMGFGATMKVLVLRVYNLGLGFRVKGLWFGV
jgi:hypothetical protein